MVNADFSAIVGIGQSGGRDIATEGQEAIAEAVAAFRD